MEPTPDQATADAAEPLSIRLARRSNRTVGELSHWHSAIIADLLSGAITAAQANAMGRVATRTVREAEKKLWGTR